MCVRVIVTLPQSFFFPLCWTICCIVRCTWGPVTCAFMYFTTAQRERRVSCKEAFIPHLSERWCREKKKGEYQCVIVCACKIVYVCSERMVHVSLGETCSCKVLLWRKRWSPVLFFWCSVRRRGRCRRRATASPPVCVAAIALFSCGDNIAPECGESSPVGEKRKKLRDCVTMFVLVQKKKKKNCGLLSYRMERINVAHAL